MAQYKREVVEFDVSGPVFLNLPKEKTHSSGCAIIDLQIKSPSDIGELVFRNYYTAWISVLVCSDPVLTKSGDNTEQRISMEDHSRGDSSMSTMKTEMQNSLANETKSNRDLTSKASPNLTTRKYTHGWMLSIPRFPLMKNPHQEPGSQDVISITANKSLVEWKNLTLIRLVLQQPSPVWRTYYVEEINLYKDLLKKSEPSPLFQNVSIYSEEYEKYMSYLNIVRSVTDAALNHERNSEENQTNSGLKMERDVCLYEFFNLSQM